MAPHLTVVFVVLLHALAVGGVAGQLPPKPTVTVSTAQSSIPENPN